MLAATLLAAPAAARTTLDLADVAARRAELNGTVVQIRGRLSDPCGGLNCALASPDGAVRLSLAAGTPVEPELARAGGREVVLEAEVSDACLNELCTDRAPELTPRRLVRVID